MDCLTPNWWCETGDEVAVHRVLQCQRCGTSLRDTAGLNWDLRQVHDLPALQLRVSEHQAEEKCCPGCGEQKDFDMLDALKRVFLEAPIFPTL